MRQVRRVAAEINRDYEGQSPLFLVVLNGAFIFAADLMREITLQAEVSFVKLASYAGTATTGTVREVIGLNTDITGRPIIIVEDIVESGITMAHMIVEEAEPQKHRHLHPVGKTTETGGETGHPVYRHGNSQRLHSGIRSGLRRPWTRT